MSSFPCLLERIISTILAAFKNIFPNCVTMKTNYCLARIRYNYSYSILRYKIIVLIVQYITITDLIVLPKNLYHLLRVSRGVPKLRFPTASLIYYSGEFQNNIKRRD